MWTWRHRSLFSTVVSLLFLGFLFFFAWADSSLVLLEQPERHSFTGFAASLAIVGDLNDDGIPDYAVGAYRETWQDNLKQGRAHLFNGWTGAVLRILDLLYPQLDAGAGMAPYHGASFGWAIVGAGDVNGDGTPDFTIWAFNQKGSGEIYGFKGKTGTLLYSLQAPQPQQSAGFGWVIASVGDLTHDGVPELLIGAFAQEGSGRVFVFDGETRALLYTLAPPSPERAEAFDWSVAALGDVDHDSSRICLLARRTPRWTQMGYKDKPTLLADGNIALGAQRP